MSEEFVFTPSQDEAFAKLIAESGLTFDPNALLNDGDFHLEPEQKPHVQDGYYPIQNGTNATINSMSNPMIQPVPSSKQYIGELQFQVMLDAKDNKTCVFSQMLQKVFIIMEATLPLKFSWIPVVNPGLLLWVRATVVYKLDQHRSVPVYRCLNHMVPENNSNLNIPDDQRQFVIRCSNAASLYLIGDNKHLSILTPLGQPQIGEDFVPVDYKFYCKNSCTSGMNRRPTEIIFTLETANNEVLGRQSMEVRICSCPKRDKEKEEAEGVRNQNNGSKKRKILPTKAPPNGKKIMMDNKVYKVEFNVVGKDNYLKILNYGLDVMGSSACRSGNLDVHKPYMDEVVRIMRSQPQ